MNSLGRRIYLDHNATTPLDPRVCAAVVDALEGCPGNPSSQHAEGREARDRVERARRQVAALVGGAPEEIVFTSGGTEAVALGIIGLYHAACAAGRPARVLVSPIEHPAVRGAADSLASRGAKVVRLRVDSEGRLDLDQLAALAPGAALVALGLVNHEIGTVQDVAAAARVACAAGALLFCDAVQAAGRMPVDVADLGVDGLALSGHKLYGPKGIGALWVRRGIDLGPLSAGGHQERERRPGTENVPGIVGFGAAAGLTPSAAGPRMAALTASLEAGLLAIDGARIQGAGAPRAPGITSAGFDGAPGELVAQALDLAGVAVSTGAACTSGAITASPVLVALGLSRERALEGVRLSLGRGTDESELAAVIELLPDLVARVRTFA